MTHTSGTRKRGGSITLEVVLVLPILILVSLAIFQFGVAMIVEQAVTHAATVAAREAGKGASLDAIEDAIETVLSVHGIEVGNAMSFILEDGDNPIVQRGALACTTPADLDIASDEVRVTLCVHMGVRPFLNALTGYGIDFSQRTYTVSAVVRKEG